MDMTLSNVNETVVAKAAARCKEKGIIIPTLAQMKDPSLVPQDIQEKLTKIGLLDFDPLHLFRITWKNDHETGKFNDGNWVEFVQRVV